MISNKDKFQKMHRYRVGSSLMICRIPTFFTCPFRNKFTDATYFTKVSGLLSGFFLIRGKVLHVCGFIRDIIYCQIIKALPTDFRQQSFLFSSPFLVTSPRQSLRSSPTKGIAAFLLEDQLLLLKAVPAEKSLLTLATIK